MDFQDHFELDPQHKILVCNKCQYAIVPAQSATHMQVYHKRLTIQQRREFVSKVATSPDLAQAHEDVIYQDPTDAPINSLPVYLDGLRCQ
jgi:hypothetical protein